MLDNAFVHIADIPQAQRLANDLDVSALHELIDHYAELCCPPVRRLGFGHHWSIMQIEYATDIVFRRQADLAPIYDVIRGFLVLIVPPRWTSCARSSPPRSPRARPPGRAPTTTARAAR